MHSLKVKLIMITIGIFIVFDDTYAISCLEECKNQLISRGYYSTDDGIANYVNLFSLFVDKYHRAIEQFDELILNSPTKKEEEDIIFLDQLYTRKILSEVSKIEMDNAVTWCKSQEDFTACTKELESRGFIYTLGITNYAFFKKEPSLLSYFTDDLQNESITSSDWCENYSNNGNMKGYSTEAQKRLKDIFKDRPDDLKTWLSNVCVGVLKVHGFGGTAKDNYDFLKTETKFIDEYIKYIVKKSTETELTANNLITGPHKWCSETCLKDQHLTSSDYEITIN